MGQEKDDLREAIKARAQEIWEEEGCPDGRDADHWSRAERELAARAADASPQDADRKAVSQDNVGRPSR